MEHKEMSDFEKGVRERRAEILALLEAFKREEVQRVTPKRKRRKAFKRPSKCVPTRRSRRILSKKSSYFEDDSEQEPYISDTSELHRKNSVSSDSDEVPFERRNVAVIEQNAVEDSVPEVETAVPAVEDTPSAHHIWRCKKGKRRSTCRCARQRNEKGRFIQKSTLSGEKASKQ